MVGAILLASALIFGAIAGGVIVHRLQAEPAASSQQEHNDNVNQQDGAPSQNKNANHGRHPSSEPADLQDKDA